MIHRRTALLGITAALAGCATKSFSDGDKLQPNEGVLALCLRAGGGGASIQFSAYSGPESSSRLVDAFLGPKGSFAVGLYDDVVRALPAGDYSWGRFTIGNKVGTLAAGSRFRILPGRINYVGDIVLNTFSTTFQVQVKDRTGEMKAHLQGKYPATLAVLPFRKSLAQFRVKSG